MNLFVSCAVGLQQVLKKELQILGYKPTILKSTLLKLEGEDSAIAQTNIRLRTANKVYLEIASQKAEIFDQLFDFVHSQDRTKYINRSAFTVKATSNNSKLFSTPTIQSISEKSIHKKLALETSEPSLRGTKQSGEHSIEILILLENDLCTILLNTSGESLHKRGYKVDTGEAPINESLAAGLILLSAWKFHEPLYDVFCGSGTIPIEAAMIAKNIAPGLHRRFAFQDRQRYDKIFFDKAKTEAKLKIMTTKKHTIIGTDSDPEMIKIAEANAQEAGVSDYIQFEVKKIKDYLGLSTGGLSDLMTGCLVSNPPYGQKMNPENLKELYQDIALLFDKNPKLNGGIITSYEQFPNFIHLKGEQATRKATPFYNGGTPCQFYKKSAI